MPGPMSRTQDLMGVTEHINLRAQIPILCVETKSSPPKGWFCNPPRTVLSTEHLQFIFSYLSFFFLKNDSLLGGQVSKCESENTCKTLAKGEGARGGLHSSSLLLMRLSSPLSLLCFLLISCSPVNMLSASWN